MLGRKKEKEGEKKEGSEGGKERGREEGKITRDHMYFPKRIQISEPKAALRVAEHQNVFCW